MRVCVHVSEERTGLPETGVRVVVSHRLGPGIILCTFKEISGSKKKSLEKQV